MRQVVCCEHNPCPQRPSWWLRRFRFRPWRCPQCLRWWFSEPVYVSGDRFWQWQAAETTQLEDLPRHD